MLFTRIVRSILMLPLLFQLGLGFYSIVSKQSRISKCVSLNANNNVEWKFDGLTQTDFMNYDECILVDEFDKIVGHNSKSTSHKFTSKNPFGLLHRAFSIFIFNENNELLLQKRALHKITFPDVWTNSCCSHPLYGYQPDEVDNNDNIENGSIPGIKYAAIRKLEQELGIKRGNININDIKYLTRLHYCADNNININNNNNNNNNNINDNNKSKFLSQVDENGESFEWGEHEIDYILFIKISTSTISFIPNPDEISEIKFVNQNELKSMLLSSSCKWSPWFRIIANNFLFKWWDDLHNIFTNNKHIDYKTIHKIL
eukprot:gene10593-14232_t